MIEVTNNVDPRPPRLVIRSLHVYVCVYVYMHVCMIGTVGNVSASLSLPSKRINLSNRVENDITRSEKKGEKKIRTQGRDDRATSEQMKRMKKPRE